MSTWIVCDLIKLSNNIFNAFLFFSPFINFTNSYLACQCCTGPVMLPPPAGLNALLIYIAITPRQTFRSHFNASEMLSLCVLLYTSSKHFEFL